MYRLPPLPRDQLSEPQQRLHDAMTATAEKAFVGPDGSKLISLAQPDGALTGPMPFFLVANAAGAPLLQFSLDLAKIPGLPPDARETAILVVTGYWQAAYPRYAHYNIATKLKLLTTDQADAVVEGRKPEGLNEGCSVAYDVARRLITTPGPLPAVMWDASVNKFGKDGAVALLHFIGFYSYTSHATNGVDAPLPEGED